MLITAFYLFWPKSYQEPGNKVDSQTPAMKLVGFEPGRPSNSKYNALTHKATLP